MKADLYYIDGCPSYRHALANLTEALRLERVRAQIDSIRVADPRAAVARKLIGSPTIRLDGCDLEGPAAESRGYAYCCRVYADGAGTIGWPSVNLIRTALLTARRK